MYSSKTLVAAIAAGGWVAVVVIIVLCLVGLIAGSVFGIFFSGEDSGTGIGASEVKENVLNGIIKNLGIDKSRFEFCLDYDKAKTFQYSKLRYNPNYRVVIFGPVPHSSTGKNDSSSVIAEMKNHEGYPRVEVLSGNNAVKITKSNFKDTLNKLVCEKYI